MIELGYYYDYCELFVTLIAIVDCFSYYYDYYYCCYYTHAHAAHTL